MTETQTGTKAAFGLHGSCVWLKTVVFAHVLADVSGACWARSSVKKPLYKEPVPTRNPLRKSMFQQEVSLDNAFSIKSSFYEKLLSTGNPFTFLFFLEEIP